MPSESVSGASIFTAIPVSAADNFRNASMSCGELGSAVGGLSALASPPRVIAAVATAPARTVRRVSPSRSLSPVSAWEPAFRCLGSLMMILDLQRWRLARFPAKWTPVRVKKTRHKKELEPRSDSIGTEKALARRQRSARFLQHEGEVRLVHEFLFGIARGVGGAPQKTCRVAMAGHATRRSLRNRTLAERFKCRV